MARSESDVRDIIQQLREKKISVFDIPTDLKNHIQIVTFERKSGLRITGKRGFDIISNSFFVEEELIHVGIKGQKWSQNLSLSFDSFESYYDFLNGHIYDNACYTFCPSAIFANVVTSHKGREDLDLNRLMAKSAFVEKTIDDYPLSLSKKEKASYKKSNDITYSIRKYYHDQKFYVIQQWRISDSVIREHRHSFDYFFDFVAFLKGDLSKANLIFCDGLRFLEQWDSINFEDAKMTSALCEKFGLKYDIYEFDSTLIQSFDYAEKNESETSLALRSSRNLMAEAARKGLLVSDVSFDRGCQRVHYVSDLHLPHRIRHAQCRSKEDIIYVVQKIVDTIAAEAGSLLLINGDVSSDFTIFHLFVTILARTLHQPTAVVFTLGNHELWGFSGTPADQIATKYRLLLEQYGMYLLHNDLLYREDHGRFAHSGKEMHLIKYQDLNQMNESQISDCLRKSRYVILGGLGFSGYNMEYNANNGIYRQAIDRETEIHESKIFEDLYNRLQPVLSERNTIILTHTPKTDWCREASLEREYVYVSGHTHRNFFYDDGEYRVYSDNQIGYHNEYPHLKSFLIDNDYDCFFDYDDGIFEITSEQYVDFYRGKNIFMTFNRAVNVLYMLKRDGYYCFIHKSKSGGLTILNGGAMKKLAIQDIRHYYDNMSAMISAIKTPLSIFTSCQKNVADMVRKIGGNGTIHGCIIDIDFYNHIYVSPFDLTMMGYWASDIINKVVYPSIPALLEERCPAIFSEYAKLLEQHSEDMLALKPQTDVAVLPQAYLDTDIYKASREIKKMQKLGSNILSSWYEDILQNRNRIEHT